MDWPFDLFAIPLEDLARMTETTHLVQSIWNARRRCGSAKRVGVAAHLRRWERI